MRNLLSALLMVMLALPAFAQDYIGFSVDSAMVVGATTETQAQQLERKLTQIINRNSAGVRDSLCVYAIQPVLTVTDVKQTEGMVRNVTMARGELALSALNTETGVVYYSIVVPLEAALTGRATDAVDALIKGIKVKDPAYTRFIRNARSKIAASLAPAPEDE